MATPTLRQQVDNAIDPYYKQASSQLKSYFADSGMGIGTSTAGVRARADLDRQIAGEKSNLLEQLRLQRRQDNRAQQQLQMQNQFGLSDRAMRLYELLASLGLQEWSLSSDPSKLDARLPSQFPFFGDYSSLNFNFPKTVPGMAGDAGERKEYVPMANVRMGESPGSIDKRQADAYIQNLKAQTGAIGSASVDTTDIWSEMADFVAANNISGEQAMAPDQVVQYFVGKYGVNLVDEWQSGNFRALDLLRLMGYKQGKKGESGTRSASSSVINTKATGLPRALAGAVQDILGITYNPNR